MADTANGNKTKKNPEIFCETTAQQRLIRVRLATVKVERDLFCHRLGKYDDAKKNKDFRTFVDQIRRDGRIQVPIEVVQNTKGDAGTWILIRGHRRVAACHLLVAEKQPGFTADMELDAYEVVEADNKDLLVRSVSDNENRLNLNRAERIQATHRMVHFDVPVARAANALGVSLQTFERDLLLAQNDWMFQHFERGDIKATQASDLLKAALDADKDKPLPGGASRLANLRAGFGAWVRRQQQELDVIDQKRQGANKKPLRPQDKLVHKRLPGFLVQHWLVLIRQGQRLFQDDSARWNYSITLEKDALRIPSVKLDVKKDPPEKLAKVLAAIASVPGVLLPALQLRKDEGDQLVSDVDISTGINLLRQHGLDKLAGDIETRRQRQLDAARTRQEAERADGEPAPDAAPAPRAESDIRAEIGSDGAAGSEDADDEAMEPEEARRGRGQPVITISHDSRQCRQALARAPLAVLDLETSGLTRSDCIVSAGILVEQTAYILFVRSLAPDIQNLAVAALHQALQPLSREDLTLILHNAIFDLGFLRREGLVVQARIHDTLKLLRLLDQDRGPFTDDRADVRQPRRDLRAPAGAAPFLNYRLKDVSRQLLGVHMPELPGSMRYVDYATHRTYLASDVLGTRKLYDHLLAGLPPDLRRYHEALVVPLIPLLVDMSHLGVEADPVFIAAELTRLQRLMDELSDAHAVRHGRALGMSRAELVGWLHGKGGLNLPVLKWNRSRGSWLPSLDNEALGRLLDYGRRLKLVAALRSLALIHDYRRAASLLKRLGALEHHVLRDGRIHSTFNDIQASGRISSTYPNLQQVAKKVAPTEGKKFLSDLAAPVAVNSRNALVARDGCVLVSYDCKQADVRVLADRVASCAVTTAQDRAALSRQRRAALPEIHPYLRFLQACRNPDFRGQPPEPPPDFDPAAPDALLDAFSSSGDFYTKAVERMLGRPPKDNTERNFCKPVILGVINGQTQAGMAKILKVSEAAARDYLQAYAQAYPKEIAYKWLQYQQIALTGRTDTFAGRTRTCTAHRWMVSEPLVRLFVHYKRADSYWVECVPLMAGLRVLTTYTLRVVNVRTNRLIYDHERRVSLVDRGRYHLYAKERELVYRLPVRNWPWRNIRRVQARGEESAYEGFDATARSLFNFICQGGTADLVKLMMLRAGPVCQQFGARLLLQIHDELVFEVPAEQAAAFVPAMQAVLEQAPTPDFKTPIQVGVKQGRQFGELK